ncbi:MAG: flavodoxin family protein [bacterium]
MKKKVLVLEGSPRRGNTEIVTEWVLKGLGENGVEIKRLRVCDLNINGCQECEGCLDSKKTAGCQQEDDMLEVYELMVDSDLTIWTSPIFCWGVTSQLKAAVDRCFALLNGENLLKGANWAVVLTAGGDHFDGADLAVEMFRRLADFGKVNYLGQFVAINCTVPREVKKNRIIAQEATQFGRRLRATLIK